MNHIHNIYIVIVLVSEGRYGPPRDGGREAEARHLTPAPTARLTSLPAARPHGRPPAAVLPDGGGSGRGAGGGGSAALGDSGAIDYSVHEAWNEATNVYLLVVLASLALLVYARRNKRRIMRIFTLPPAAETPPEPNFYDSMKKIRLRQQLEMYSIARKFEQQQQPPKQTESIQLSVE
ncbi:small integral membrane protein 19 [Gymnogyps californianus]|uniref:small integral membrane protein 19 n=1 Tax=Gymnogyps californianus TaxID=33616 RepID=UPI0021C8EEDE|nr:small integral membrane protein 19 [Gymnogyps californianus]